MVAGEMIQYDTPRGYHRTAPGLNRQSKVPLHQQIYEILRKKIAREDWAPGNPFPTEVELMDTYQVSRITIRQVMDRLVSEGLVYRQQGRGSFVAQATLEQGLTRIISFTEDMRRRGLVPETKILAQEIIAAGKDVSTALMIHPGDQVAYLRRLRFANHEPLCIEESHLIHRMCPGIFETDFTTHSLRETLEKKYSIHIMRANQKIHAIIAGPETCRLFQVESPAAFLFIERVSFNEWDQPVEFLRYYFRGDKYTLHAELKN